ncbi:hypothetical protein [Stenotrophomonas maltophilia group sp. LNF259]
MTTERLTAAMAENITRSKDPAFAVDTILKGIRAAAVNGKREYITREYGFGDGSCYTAEDNYPALCKAILKELRDLGYKADIGSSCGQFVDVWLFVRWGDQP